MHRTLRSFVLAVVPALVVVSSSLPAVAQEAVAGSPAPGRWELLGSRTVDGKIDRDAIAVGRDDGLFDAVQLKVEGSDIVLLDLKIVFGNGEVFEPKTRLVFNQGSKTREIALPGKKRAIKRVEFRSANLAGGGRARVEAWGRDLTPPRWDVLGERQVNGRVDRDAIQVGAEEGEFRAIQLKVTGSSLIMSEVKIVFENGQVFEPKTRLVFDKNTSTRVIDLPGNKRKIKRVEFRYGNLPGGGAARVAALGMR